MRPVRVIHSVTSLSTPGVKPRPRGAGQPALAGPSWRPAAPRAAQLAGALAGLVAIGSYLFIALSRLDYPFTVEWLEGNSLVEVHRILAGQPLYPAPSAGYVPDGYPPLYFAVSAAAARVLGLSYLPLRLVSVVSSLACHRGPVRRPVRARHARRHRRRGAAGRRCPHQADRARRGRHGDCTIDGTAKESRP
jgi:hypothetical protein